MTSPLSTVLQASANGFVQSRQQARLLKIADRLEEYAQEIEEFASDMEEGVRCDALFTAHALIDQAATILEKLPA